MPKVFVIVRAVVMSLPAVDDRTKLLMEINVAVSN